MRRPPKLSPEVSVCQAGTNSVAKMLLTIALTAIAMAVSTLFLLLVYRRTSRSQGKKHFAVVVLGDVGRSPRMQYHTVSLSEVGDERDTSVTLIGYSGEECIESLRNKKNVGVYRLNPFKNRFPGIPFVFFALYKVTFQILQLAWCLFVNIPTSNAILVQNPPSIPTLFIVWIACKLHGASFIIDWHNFGYTILSLKLSKSHPLVVLSKLYERFFGQFADSGLCVTKAMKHWLKSEWGINANVLYDRPPLFFRRTTVAEKHALFRKLEKEFRSIPGSVDNDTTLFTARKNGEIVVRKDRPLLAISSTSWTPDEDFGVLLDAIVKLGESIQKRRVSAKKRKAFPNIIFIITGKGPQKAMYQAKIAELQLAQYGIYILTMWLESGDYPLLLGSADLGISLHTSSSGK